MRCAARSQPLENTMGFLSSHLLSFAMSSSLTRTFLPRLHGITTARRRVAKIGRKKSRPRGLRRGSSRLVRPFGARKKNLGREVWGLGFAVWCAAVWCVVWGLLGAADK
jgi:hypothetical protein